MQNLVICAHIDDEFLGCSSILDKNCIVISVCGSDDRIDKFKDLRDSTGSTFINLKLDEGSLNQINTFEFKDFLKRSIHPYINDETNIFTHFEDDLHTDHRIVCEAVKTIFRPNRIRFKSLNYFYTTSFNNKPNKFLLLDINNKIKQLNLAIETNYLNKNDVDSIINYNKFVSSFYSNDYVEPFYQVLSY